MDTNSTPVDSNKNKKHANKNLILSLFIFISLLGIVIGLYLLDIPAIFRSGATVPEVHEVCGPQNHCNDYGWKDGVGYTKVPDNCRIGVWMCKNSDWNQAFSSGCQGSIAYFHKIYSAKDGKGYLKPVPPPVMCGIWQMDVSCPDGGRSFHSRGDRRDSICKATPETHNECDGMACKKVSGPGNNECVNAGTNPAPQCSHKKCENFKCVLVAGGNVDNKCENDNDCLVSPTPTNTPTPTPTPPSCPVPSPVNNLKINCPLCN